MNKKEFIKRLIDMGGCGAKPGTWARGWDDAIGDVLGIAEELDEPKKPVIPQFVADYIEERKYSGLIMSEWFKIQYNDDNEYKVGEWLYDNDDDEVTLHREFRFIDAIRYGYEVEREKRYYIIDKTNNSTLMTFELSDVVGEEVIEFVYGYSENETIHFNSKEKAELIAHFVGESLEVEEVTE